MKKVTKYEACDGSVFDTEDKCQKYEVKIDAIDAIMATLRATPKDATCNFSNGHGFIRQDANIVKKAMIALVKLAKVDLGTVKDAFNQNPFKYRDGYIGRALDDNGGPEYYAWLRFMCMDSRYREWGQCYYALHPEKGELIEL